MSEEKVLSMEEFLSEPDVEYATIPGLKPGTVLRIGSLSAGDLIEWSEANEGDAKRTAGLRLIVKSMVDKDGVRIGTDKHIVALRNKSHKLTERLVKEILSLNGMTVAADAAAKKD
jgi:hypothetical protein